MRVPPPKDEIRLIAIKKAMNSVELLKSNFTLKSLQYSSKICSICILLEL